MTRLVFWLVVALLANPLRAVENIPSSSFNTTQPANTDIPNWTSGWAQPNLQPSGYTWTTGWNYVGSVGGNSAVYLGNSWVLTAAHVGVDGFYLNGVTYPVLSGTTHTFGTADLVLFQVSPAPNLPGLPLRSSAPVANVSPVAIVGWGAGNDNRVETWGYNTPINLINESVDLANNGVTYTSTDFVTLTVTTSTPPKNPDNPYEVQMGDSGGADFIYNTKTSVWELAGINEGTSMGDSFEYPDGTYGSYSVFVQLSAYVSQINAIVNPPVNDSPTMPPMAVFILGGLLFVAGSSAILRGKAPC